MLSGLILGSAPLISEEKIIVNLCNSNTQKLFNTPQGNLLHLIHKLCQCIEQNFKRTLLPTCCGKASDLSKSYIYFSFPCIRHHSVHPAVEAVPCHILLWSVVYIHHVCFIQIYLTTLQSLTEFSPTDDVFNNFHSSSCHYLGLKT